MMEFFNVYSYGNAMVLSDLLNGIALIVNNSGYGSFIRIGIIIAFGSLLVTTAFDLKLGRVVKWYAMVMMIYMGLIFPKATVVITDPVLQIAPIAVDNVPIGLVFTLSTLTTIEYLLTEELETVMHVPDDQSYNKTGMMMASDMVRKASSFKILDPDFANNIRSYVQQCIQYDILHGKYTVKELFNSGNVWEFSKGHASDARAFIYSGNINTCKIGAMMLDDDWNKEIAQAMPVFARRMFGSNQQIRAQEQLSKYLWSSYNHIAGISSTASSIMQQNMMINAFHDGVVNNAGELGAAAAVESYAVARATQHSRSAYKVSGEVAGRLLPYMKNVMQLLLIGAFVIILPLFFFISGIGRLRAFVEFLASLSLWGPLYAILNLQMTSAGRDKIIGLTYQPAMADKAAITIANLPGVEQIAADQVILAGYLALSIPLIAYGLIKSSMHAFNSLASGVMGVAQSSSGSAAEESISGNYSLGNVSLDNTNAYNTSSFHNDSNVRGSSGSVTLEAMDGTSSTSFSDGGMKVDTRGAGSNFLTSTNFGSNLQSALSKSYTDSTTAAEIQSTDLTNTLTTAFHGAYDLAKQVGNSINSDASRSLGYSASDVQAMNEYVNLIDSVSEQTGATTNEVIAAAASIHANKGIIPGFIGASGSISGSSDASVNQHDAIREELSKNEGVSQILDSASRVSSDTSHRTSEDSSTRLAESIKSDFSEADGIRTSMMTNIQNAQATQHAMNHSQTNSADIKTAGDKIIFDELRKTVNPDTGRNYTPSDITALDTKEPEKFKEIITPIVEKYAHDIVEKSKAIDAMGGKIQGLHEAKSQEIIAQGEQLKVKHDENKGNISKDVNLRPVNNEIINAVDAKIKGNQDSIAHAKEKLAEKEDAMKSKFIEEKDKSLSVKAVTNAGKRFDETRKDVKGYLAKNLSTTDDKTN